MAASWAKGYCHHFGLALPPPKAGRYTETLALPRISITLRRPPVRTTR